MKTIKISSLWGAGYGTVYNSILISIINKISNSKVIFSNPSDCDILILGPYNIETISEKFFKFFKKKVPFDILKKNIEKYERKILFRRYSPLTIFYSTENTRQDSIEADFKITQDLGVNSKNHLRIPVWKENIDWSKEGFFRENNISLKGKNYKYHNIIRFGEFYSLEKLMSPLSKNFLNKEKEFCIITSHLREPRKSIYDIFNQNFSVDGYGPYFDNKIKNHNSSNFTKKEILMNYKFNLCPQNSSYPGYFEERVPEAFLCDCLPITWADNNIEHDFNPASFINLNNYINSSYKEIIEKLKDQNYLRSFIDQPLLLKKPNLDNEIRFCKNILDKL